MRTACPRLRLMAAACQRENTWITVAVGSCCRGASHSDVQERPCRRNGLTVCALVDDESSDDGAYCWVVHLALGGDGVEPLADPLELRQKS